MYIRDYVDRRIGGLENNTQCDFWDKIVDRRIGGLESSFSFLQQRDYVDRRIGGLEKLLLSLTISYKVDRRIGGLENNGGNISKVKYRSLSRVSGGDPARPFATSLIDVKIEDLINEKRITAYEAGIKVLSEFAKRYKISWEELLWGFTVTKNTPSMKNCLKWHRKS